MVYLSGSVVFISAVVLCLVSKFGENSFVDIFVPSILTRTPSHLPFYFL